jgi:hypothetical protein
MTAAPSAPAPQHSMPAAQASCVDRQASHSCPGACLLLQEQACAGAALAWVVLQDRLPAQLRCLAGAAAGSQQQRELSQQQPKRHLLPQNPAVLLRAFLHLCGQPSGISHTISGQDLVRA